LRYAITAATPISHYCHWFSLPLLVDIDDSAAAAD
jgi:hypothetical protein